MWVYAKLGNGRSTVWRVLFRRRALTEPHCVLGQTRWVLRKTRWVRFGTQIVGREELTEFAPWNSVSPKKLTEFGVWNRTPRNRIRPVSEIRSPANTWKAVWCICIFPCSPLKTSNVGIRQTSFWTFAPPKRLDVFNNWGRGSGGVKSTGVSQSVGETSRDESQNVLSTRKLFKTRDLELPNF